MPRWAVLAAGAWAATILVMVALGWLRARARDRRMVSANLKAVGSYTDQLDYMRRLDMELDERTKDVTQ